MGLFGAKFAFEGGVPAMEEIAGAILSLMAEPLVVVRDAGSEEAMASESRSTLLVCDELVRMTLAARRRPTTSAHGCLDAQAREHIKGVRQRPRAVAADVQRHRRARRDEPTV